MTMLDLFSGHAAMRVAVQIARRGSKWSVDGSFPYLLSSSQIAESFAEPVNPVVPS